MEIDRHDIKMRGYPRLGGGLIVTLLICLALGPKAQALWQLTWDRIEVDAHLDNRGALHVRERMSVTVAGNVSMLDRRIATSTDQVFILRRLVWEDDGVDRELVDGWDQKDRYMWRDQTLTWWLKDEKDPEWQGQTLVYRFDYELRNALTPVWDIPAGPDPFLYPRERFPRFLERLGATLAAWRQAPASFDRRYRLEHNVIFPRFAESDMKELKYTLRYDEAWRRVHPETAIGRGTLGDYRVTQLLDYLTPGWPPALDLWKPAVRVGSIMVFAALAVLWWAIFAGGAVRRWGLLPQLLDRRWFEDHIGSQRPEILATDLGKGRMMPFVPPFLGRLRASGVIAVRREPAVDEKSDPTIHLQLRRDPGSLQPHERLMIGALFPQGPESGSALLAQYYDKPGFDPEKVFAEAIDHEREEREKTNRAEPPKRSLFWRVIRRISPLVCWSAAALLILDAYHAQKPMVLILFCIPLVFAVAFLPHLLFRFETPVSGGIAALVTLAPVLVAGMTVVSLHFFQNVPLAATGSAGLALVALWSAGALLFCAQDVDGNARTRQQRLAALGARYAREELRKPQPGLDDTWLPHLTVLGLDPQVTSWCNRDAAGKAINSSSSGRAEPGIEGARPFTGVPPFPVEEEWGYALYVPSEEERREEAEEEERENEGEKSGGS